MDEIPSPAGQPPRGEHRRQRAGLAGLLLSSACRWGQDLLRVPVFVIFLLVELPKVSGLSFRLAMSHFSLLGWRICSVPHLCFSAPRPFPSGVLFYLPLVTPCSLPQAALWHQRFWVAQRGLQPSGRLVAMSANLTES